MSFALLESSFSWVLLLHLAYCCVIIYQALASLFSSCWYAGEAQGKRIRLWRCHTLHY